MSQHISLMLDDPLYEDVETVVEEGNEWDNRSQFLRFCIRGYLDSVDADRIGIEYGSDSYRS